MCEVFQDKGSVGCQMMATVRSERQNQTVLLNVLSNLGLQKYYPNKLTLQSLLEVNRSSIYENDILSVEQIPFYFLRKLFKINAGCRNYTRLSSNHEEIEDNFDLLDIYTEWDLENTVHPLDLIVGLFLCADSFLQQEMALKMSLCQFSVPLLLPHCNNNCTLMVWALREIVKEWCPHNLCQDRGFVESNIVQAKIPFFSFVRLKNCSLSKSQLLNCILSCGQQNHNIFIHRDMEGGALTRKISNTLVEVCWFLPCGRANLDRFPEPITFANLRGDIFESFTQFHFLYEVSNAMFVFLDKVEDKEHNILTALQDAHSKLHFVINRKEGALEDMKSVKKTLQKLNLPNSSVKIKDSRVNMAEFSLRLCEAIRNSLSYIKQTMSMENMLDKAIELGLSVDENKTLDQKKTAKDIMTGVNEGSIAHYKKQQLPLQGENWKKLSQLEMKECRMYDVSSNGAEHCKAKLQADKSLIWEKQNKQKLSKGMQDFIVTLSTSDKEQRNVFLKWMKLILNSHSREKLTALRKKFKEHSKTKDAKLIAKIDQELLDSSLGVEHYMREMGLNYEVSMQSGDPTGKFSHLPGIAAEMLLDGYPLELLDGDASNIPEKWVTAVLMELHKKVGGKSNLVVLTVLGVQSTGKSTLLNTMFGVHFPVSSGRCTRGAYMLFLKVGDDTQAELGCDFILLIDTEGLKSPDLAQLEDSYEHDNQLATFVICLSDVTIINIAMENATEMKDVLQIAVHAFIRMKRIGKDTVCHFVHQNVAGVSAHAKNSTERQHLLVQLNEMTQIAAEMERQPSIQAFTDVLSYNLEKNNWNIPGLWHGTPPMAPVNTGYSEAVADFKKNLLETVGKERSHDVSKIPHFLEWMSSLWKAVKYENFIFSFRNTLVAHAYDNLCKEFAQWEWEMRKTILSWQTVAESEILNANNEDELEPLLTSKKSKLSEEIQLQKSIFNGKLSDYYREKDRCVKLVEKYKSDFFKSIVSLSNEIEHSVRTKLDRVHEVKIGLKKAQDIQQEYYGSIENRVLKLLSDFKNVTLSDSQLKKEFDKMWTAATANVPTLKEQDIPAYILAFLKKHFSNRNVNENFRQINNLKGFGMNPFKARIDHVDSVGKKLKHLWKGDLQIFADNVIETATMFVLGITKSNHDYHDSLSRDLLLTVDDLLVKGHNHHQTNAQFEIDIKLHICGIAAREFLKLHQRFLLKNDPRAQLEKYKDQYLLDFLDLYKKTDHSQRKANDFVQLCIKPAIEDCINSCLGTKIVDTILRSSLSMMYSTPSCFQYSIQEELLHKDDFKSFLKYICHYETYVREKILFHICQEMDKDNALYKLKKDNTEIVVDKILNAMKEASTMQSDDDPNILKLVKKMRNILIEDIVIPEEVQQRTLFQIQSTCKSFTKSFITSMNTLKETLFVELTNENTTETLNKLKINPQNELFRRVVVCGQQCPFCKTPCEAGGKEHKKHHAAVHRPQGLGGYSNVSTDVLVDSLCTTDVQSNSSFQNRSTHEKWVKYKDYSTIYPDWHIPPDATREASNYWKYVLVRYNEEFASKYLAKPANVPNNWKTITKEQALQGSKDAFSIK